MASIIVVVPVLLLLLCACFDAGNKRCLEIVISVAMLPRDTVAFHRGVKKRCRSLGIHCGYGSLQPT